MGFKLFIYNKLSNYTPKITGRVVNQTPCVHLAVYELLREAGSKRTPMGEVLQDHVRGRVELLVLGQHVTRGEELIALVADQKLIVGIVRISEDLEVAAV